MSRLPRVNGRRVLGALRRAGFELSHIRGSHHYLHKPGVPGLVVVPLHGSRTVPIGTLHAILKQAGLTQQEFIELL